ncbi:hypothetical protein DKX38_018632 [Salix brachista]|uniref:Uncharacterized protein n=1 Tax=Salix brachista TaxID=2182728 RepID=A0A5N5KNI8_9ROSI|nr:hypothetical protein DKX38_018632 [Salix brachista]
MHSLETCVHGLELALDEISYDLVVSSGRMTNAGSNRTICFTTWCRLLELQVLEENRRLLFKLKDFFTQGIMVRDRERYSEDWENRLPPNIPSLDVWDTLETLFHQQIISRVDILHDTLLDTYKNDMSIEAYFAKIKELERIRGHATPPLTSLPHHALVTQQHYQSFCNVTHVNSSQPYQPKQVPIETSLDYVSPLWLGDTGATNHMASYIDLVQQLIPFIDTSDVYVDLAIDVTLLKRPVKDNLYLVLVHALSYSLCNSPAITQPLLLTLLRWLLVQHGTAGLAILVQKSCSTLLIHSQFVVQQTDVEPLNASTTTPRVEPPSLVAQSPLPTTTSNSYVTPNQSAIQLSASPSIPIISNPHPMITRAKVDIRKPRALYANNYPLPQYLL